jgi:glutamate racemase
MQAIGLFDSGIGGLTVANAFNGTNCPTSRLYILAIQRICRMVINQQTRFVILPKRSVQFLLSKECKILVIACNTASSVAFDMLENMAGDKAYVFNRSLMLW